MAQELDVGRIRVVAHLDVDQVLAHTHERHQQDQRQGSGPLEEPLLVGRAHPRRDRPERHEAHGHHHVESGDYGRLYDEHVGRVLHDVGRAPLEPGGTGKVK